MSWGWLMGQAVEGHQDGESFVTGVPESNDIRRAAEALRMLTDLTRLNVLWTPLRLRPSLDRLGALVPQPLGQVVKATL